MTAPVIRAADVRHAPPRTYELFTQHIGAWWPLGSHGAFGSGGTLGFEGDRLVERSLGGDEAVWAEVTTWEPPERFVMQWHPGRSADDASEVEVRFAPVTGGTRVEIEHRGWERFGSDAEMRRASYAGPNAWGYVLDHFGHLAEAAGVAGEDELQVLADAYDAFFAGADQGGFAEPTDGGWSAAQTVAHVALNDIAMAAVGRDLIDRGDPHFENETCQDRAVLGAVAARCGTFAALVSFGRQQAQIAQDVVRRLDAEQLATEVPCRLLHDGEVVMDGAMPWQTVAATVQAARHLPAHVDQLRNLR